MQATNSAKNKHGNSQQAVWHQLCSRLSRLQLRLCRQQAGRSTVADRRPSPALFLRAQRGGPRTPSLRHPAACTPGTQPLSSLLPLSLSALQMAVGGYHTSDMCQCRIEQVITHSIHPPSAMYCTIQRSNQAGKGPLLNLFCSHCSADAAWFPIYFN